MGQDVVMGETASAGSLEVVVAPGSARVRLLGEVDLGMVTAIRTRLHELVVDGHTELVVELDGVSFMDSSGLGALVSVHRQARVFRGSLVLVAPSPPVSRLLSLTGLDRVFDVRPGHVEA